MEEEPSGKLHISLDLTKDYRKVKSRISEILTAKGIKDFDIVLAPKGKNKTLERETTARIKKIIAVHSCKGGVGKSTVALNIAFALSKVSLLVPE